MTSARLKPPIRELLDDELSEKEVRDLWIRIAPGPRRPTPFFIAWSLGCVAVGAMLAWYAPTETPTALRLANHVEVPPSMASPGGAPLALGDGSAISTERGARLELLENTGKTFSVALRTGRAHFDIRPGGPRTWRVECGKVSVEVIGTRFVVDRTAERVTVEVERGVVIVRGDPVPDQVVRLVAGTKVTVPTEAATTARTTQETAGTGDIAVRAPGASAAPSPPNAMVAPEVAPAKDFDPRAPSASTVAKATTPRPPESPSDDRRGENPTSTDSTSEPRPSAGAPRSSASDADEPSALFRAADLSRREGRYDDAVRSLIGLVTRHPGDPETSLAELTLGRIFLDTLGRPADAAEYIERALGLGLPAVLAEDAAARVVEAYARSGNPERAAGARKRYLRLFPRGTRADYVNRWAPPAR